jgi:hypothetical protein
MMSCCLTRIASVKQTIDNKDHKKIFINPKLINGGMKAYVKTPIKTGVTNSSNCLKLTDPTILSSTVVT